MFNCDFPTQHHNFVFPLMRFAKFDFSRQTLMFAKFPKVSRPLLKLFKFDAASSELKHGFAKFALPFCRFLFSRVDACPFSSSIQTRPSMKITQVTAWFAALSCSGHLDSGIDGLCSTAMEVHVSVGKRSEKIVGGDARLFHFRSFWNAEDAQRVTLKPSLEAPLKPFRRLPSSLKGALKGFSQREVSRRA